MADIKDVAKKIDSSPNDTTSTSPNDTTSTLSREEVNNKLLQQLNQAEAKNVAALAFSAQQEKIDRVATVKTARAWRLATLLTIVGIIGFVVGNIWVRRFQFPRMFKWYDQMKNDKYKGRSSASGASSGYAPFYSMYQVTTVMQFEPVGYLLCGMTVWTCMDKAAAIFLAKCVDYFTDQGLELTSLHWNGSPEQTNASMLVGASGWASSGCGTSALTPEERKNALIQNWVKGNVPDPKRASLKLNIWYDFFPDPNSQRDQFLNLCIMKELWRGDATSCGGTDAMQDACVPNVFKNSHIWQLFDGGLCRVAFDHTNESETGTDLFSKYFVGTPSVKSDCSAAYAAGAVTGATAAMSGLLPVAGIATGGAFLAAALAVTAVGAAGGALASGNAARKSCEDAQSINQG